MFFYNTNWILIAEDNREFVIQNTLDKKILILDK